jgi:hypothetical protein
MKELIDVVSLSVGLYPAYAAVRARSSVRCDSIGFALEIFALFCTVLVTLPQRLSRYIHTSSFGPRIAPDVTNCDPQLLVIVCDPSSSPE